MEFYIGFHNSSPYSTFCAEICAKQKNKPGKDHETGHARLNKNSQHLPIGIADASFSNKPNPTLIV
jgi:hypothetical protein